MRKLVSILLAVSFILCMASFALAEEEVIEASIAKIIDEYAVKTSWGNVYFQIRDVHKLTHGAAKLRPVYLGTFTTDTGYNVKVTAIGYDKGIAKLKIKKF